MGSFGLLHIEANIFNPFGNIEIQQFLRRMHALFRKHGNDMEGNIPLAQKTNSRDRAIESPFAGSGHAVRIVETRRSIDTYTYANLPFHDEVTPLFIDQHSVGLNGMPQFDGSRSY